MDIDTERETVLKIEELIQAKDFGQICFEVGKFIEKVASEIYLNMNNANPKSAKTAIDSLIEKRLVSRPLGFKLHVIREMRNVEAHNLPYSITSTDAQIAVDALNQTIEWLHQGNLAREWQEIHESFNEGASLIQHPTSNIDDRTALTSVFNIYMALERAVHLKIKTLNLEAKRMSFFSSVELLAKHGVDVRSNSWRQLVEMRNKLAHSRASDPSPKELYSLLKRLLPELHEVLTKLNPLDDKSGNAADYPQVHSKL